MKMSLRYRIHEWLAEHFDAIQYPGVEADGPLFRQAMPWEQRLLLVLLGVLLVGVSMLVIGGGLFVVAALLAG